MEHRFSGLIDSVVGNEKMDWLSRKKRCNFDNPFSPREKARMRAKG